MKQQSHDVIPLRDKCDITMSPVGRRSITSSPGVCPSWTRTDQKLPARCEKNKKNKKLKSGVESESEQILSFLCNGSGDQSQKGRLLVIDYSFL